MNITPETKSPKAVRSWTVGSWFSLPDNSHPPKRIIKPPLIQKNIILLLSAFDCLNFTTNPIGNQGFGKEKAESVSSPLCIYHL
ncbi:hypothetical protein COV28_03010 [candidate division WWE3 bacterium CG10_big_fil_rev_8_21_14_0_10_48_23]|uniref:Uncharacterized protein n=1 Tax=candidate division WWE3 bacterium CG_4_9_14_0_2_um_filter_48_10 TaxID=1975078 RepID=A0A2M8EJI9_UNCKA|nr:MAG: hypothetical protein COY35_00675 [candidate division WWE3 bacterium CG_4_10_14_0_2_um_filter_47_8]PJC22868.1 MAG: hypothetical protein CO059_01465 [candidate division WWE3 bacterium CG_4_9_14_0_2_um_filter_48_10]PJE50458.1 MAG: hypothetical protein COV28_03010 [candidate division WWE3 bacterium CG10_big_fil_rev_8_21_14_0_10_48_23]